MTTGAERLLDVLSNAGIRFIFGNPGTTEMPIMHALRHFPEIQYVLGLQETAVVAMADGYAKASGRASFVNLHTAGGLGHAMGALLHSRIAKTPMLVTVGQQDTRHSHTDPLLYGDAVTMAASTVKWAREVQHPHQVVPMVRRALEAAETPPLGPTFLSLPINVLTAETTLESAEKSKIDRNFLASGLGELASALAEVPPDKLAVIVSDEVAASDAGSAFVEVADILGARVYGPSWPSEVSFPVSHPLWNGHLPTTAEGIRATLSGVHAVFIVGDNPFISYLYSEGPALPHECRLYQLTGDGNEAGRTYATQLACIGSLKPSLASLKELLLTSPKRNDVAKLRHVALIEQKLRHNALEQTVQEQFSDVPIPPFVAAAEVAASLSHNVIVVDEAPATMVHMRSFLERVSINRYFFMRSAILGWGLPAAVGVALASPSTPVVALIGDGSALYAPQALWTAARFKLPVTFVIMNNSEYNILKRYSVSQGYEVGGNSTIPGMELENPFIDYQALAMAFGVPSRRVTHADEVQPAIKTAMQSGLPSLIEIVIRAS